MMTWDAAVVDAAVVDAIRAGDTDFVARLMGFGNHPSLAAWSRAVEPLTLASSAPSLAAPRDKPLAFAGVPTQVSQCRSSLGAILGGVPGHQGAAVPQGAAEPKNAAAPPWMRQFRQAGVDVQQLRSGQHVESAEPQNKRQKVHSLSVGTGDSSGMPTVPVQAVQSAPAPSGAEHGHPDAKQLDAKLKRLRKKREKQIKDRTAHLSVLLNALTVAIPGQRVSVLQSLEWRAFRAHFKKQVPTGTRAKAIAEYLADPTNREARNNACAECVQILRE